MRFRSGLGIALVLSLWCVVLWPGFTAAETAADRQQRIEASTEASIKASMSQYELGRMYEQAGDLLRAEQYYQEALKLWPENQEARVALQRILDSRKPQDPPQPFWIKWLALITGGGAGAAYRLVELFGLLVGVGLLLVGFFKVTVETVRLAFLRFRGIPVLGLGEVTDPTGRLPGLAHLLAANMNAAGLTFYDEKGAVLPDFTFVGTSGFPQAKFISKLLEIIHTRHVQRIHVNISVDDGLLNAAVSLVDSKNGSVRYLQVVSTHPERYKNPGELSKVMARLVADSILITLSRDSNTRGLLYQRMGDWSSALAEFQTAAASAEKKGNCSTYYQAHLNLGNLYSFLGLQDKSVAAYSVVADKVKNPSVVALVQAAMACSYANWHRSSPDNRQPTYQVMGRQALEKALAVEPKTPLVAYTIACYYSLSEQMQECLHWLREAASSDLAYLNYAGSDPDMEPLYQWLDGRPLPEALGLRFTP